MTDLLLCKPFQCKVSSVLNRNVKEYGKKFLTDGKEDTCWNSEQGRPQWVSIAFEEEQSVSEIRLMFQGGFAGKNCQLQIEENKQTFDFFPEDSNKLQTFCLPQPLSGKIFRITFPESSDFFGRITLYQLSLIEG